MMFTALGSDPNFFGLIWGHTQGLLLVLNSGITQVGSGTLWDAVDQTQVGCVQQKPFLLCYSSCLSDPNSDLSPRSSLVPSSLVCWMGSGHAIPMYMLSTT